MYPSNLWLPMGLCVPTLWECLVLEKKNFLKTLKFTLPIHFPLLFLTPSTFSTKANNQSLFSSTQPHPYFPISKPLQTSIIPGPFIENPLEGYVKGSPSSTWSSVWYHKAGKVSKLYPPFPPIDVFTGSIQKMQLNRDLNRLATASSYVLNFLPSAGDDSGPRRQDVKVQRCRMKVEGKQQISASYRADVEPLSCLCLQSMTSMASFQGEVWIFRGYINHGIV